MALNKKHKDYPEFRRRWDEIIEESMKEMDVVMAEEEKKDECDRGLDGPSTAVSRKYGKQLAALQREYKHLYE